MHVLGAMLWYGTLNSTPVSISSELATEEENLMTMYLNGLFGPAVIQTRNDKTD